MKIIEQILHSRGICSAAEIDNFLNPNYNSLYDYSLMPDIELAVDRLKKALSCNELIYIYGDYDIDGLSATALVYDALSKIGFKNLRTFIPNRFVDGYGLSSRSVEDIASQNCNLIVTVDCGSRSIKEIELANSLGIDVIVTDHHEIGNELPSAVAVVNPKRPDSKYPFKELAGVGVAFKLICALQNSIDCNFSIGQEKWLLDLVALGTICDVVPLVGENRILAKYGLQVLSKTRRVGLLELFKIARLDNTSAINARSVGFVIGPRMNASGRLQTAQYSLDLLMSNNRELAYKCALKLEEINNERKKEQLKIQKQAEAMAENDKNPVLVLSSPDWNHGVVGIVAARLLEKYKKPVFLLQNLGEESKGSARSFGDFSAVDGVEYCRDLLIKGGGHKLAAGILINTSNLDSFRSRINEFYKNKISSDQQKYLLPAEDVSVCLSELTIDLFGYMEEMEPFGNGNKKPVFLTKNLRVRSVKYIGSEAQHMKVDLVDQENYSFQVISFNVLDDYKLSAGDLIDLWYEIELNVWNGFSSIEGRLLHLEKIV